MQPHGEGEIQVINPTTEDIIGSVPVGNSDDVNRAVSAARSAFESWSMSPIEDRIRILNDLSTALKELTEDTSHSPRVGKGKKRKKLLSRPSAPARTRIGAPPRPRT